MQCSPSPSSGCISARDRPVGSYSGAAWTSSSQSNSGTTSQRKIFSSAIDGQVAVAVTLEVEAEVRRPHGAAGVALLPFHLHHRQLDLPRRPLHADGVPLLLAQERLAERRLVADAARAQRLG